MNDEQRRAQILSNINDMNTLLFELMAFRDALGSLELDGIDYSKEYFFMKTYFTELDRFFIEREQFDIRDYEGYVNFARNYYYQNPFLSFYWDRFYDLLGLFQTCARNFPQEIGRITNWGMMNTIQDVVERLAPDGYWITKDENLSGVLPFVKKLAFIQREAYRQINRNMENHSIQIQDFSTRLLEGESTPEFLAETNQKLFLMQYAIQSMFA